MQVSRGKGERARKLMEEEEEEVHQGTGKTLKGWERHMEER